MKPTETHLRLQGSTTYLDAFKADGGLYSELYMWPLWCLGDTCQCICFA